MTTATPTLSPLKNRTFRAIWLASFVSNLGALIEAVGAAWMMTYLSDSANMVAMVQASTTLPVVVLSLACGAIADNFDRRRVMLAAQVFMLMVSISLAACAFWGLMTPWLLLAFTSLIGCGNALNNPSWHASVGDIVVRSEVPSAVALNNINYNITRSIGPAIGGAIVAAAGVAAAFAVNVVCYFALIGVLLRWRHVLPPKKLPREPLVTAMQAGPRYVAMSPNILNVLTRSFIFGLAAVSVLALLPLVARDLVGGGALTYGVLLGCFGIGAVAGALFIGRLRARSATETIVRAAFVGFALCALLCAVGSALWQTAVALLIGGAAWVVNLTTLNVTVQLSTPRWVVGRAMSLFQTANFGGMALGSGVWGVTADAYGVDVALICSAAALLAGLLLGLRFALPADTDLDLDPHNRWAEPEIRLDLQPRSGPIAVTIEYAIDEARLGDFLAAMAECRRVRRRDGARHWTLTRDLEDPRLWVESFQLPTWAEYVRYNMRSTNADAAVGDRLQSLHQGPEGPRVRCMIVRPTDPAASGVRPYAAPWDDAKRPSP